MSAITLVKGSKTRDRADVQALARRADSAAASARTARQKLAAVPGHLGTAAAASVGGAFAGLAEAVMPDAPVQPSLVLGAVGVIGGMVTDSYVIAHMGSGALAHAAGNFAKSQAQSYMAAAASAG